MLKVPPDEAAHSFLHRPKKRKRAVASHLLPTYARVDLAFERGEGAWLIATNGERYLDFTSGVAVNALGHAHPKLIEAITAQIQKVSHVSNLFRIPEGERLADRLCKASFADTVFFGNSGAEANELAIKMARKYQYAIGKPEKYRIITFEGAFHGRTLATLAATGNKKYLEGFGPVSEGFDQLQAGDLDAVKKAVTPETAAIMIEPIQAEGGVRVIDQQFMKGLREICDKNDLLLIFDEVQTGMGRTGELFAYQRTGVTPDIMSLAKAIGGGFPFGACLATASAAQGMTAGTHGSTFGGNPLAMAAGNAVMDVMTAPGFLENVRKNALLLKQRLAELKDRYPRVILELRGEGLLIGLRLAVPNTEMVNELRNEHMLVAGAGDNVVRLLPPLIIGEAEMSEAIGMIDRACARLAKENERAPKREPAA